MNLDTQKMTKRIVSLGVASIVILMLVSGCSSGRRGNRVIRSDSQQRVGMLRLQIVECASGGILYQGTHEVLARDVAITQSRGLDGSICFDKRIDLSQSFYVQMNECAGKTRDEIDGFSLSPGRVGYALNWEWFDASRDNQAVKLQESGELTFIPVQSGSIWEVGRIEVKKEISLRVFGRDPSAPFRNAPSWRIQVKEGSYVEWPSAAGGVAVLHSFPVPGPSQQLVGSAWW
ncbi:MAG TPA: hypothetical protein VJT71_00280 [Pyrinomonadaceae bacterium]|nr:hypothetical protein [Pyrinomonadaceae bacterium]